MRGPDCTSGCPVTPISMWTDQVEIVDLMELSVAVAAWQAAVVSEFQAAELRRHPFQIQLFKYSSMKFGETRHPPMRRENPWETFPARPASIG
eukprot:scaffold379_cov235-Pinguiococcus_pyrenoidosus.AAC.2